MKIGCIVMAAGNARRFGSNKLDARVEGKTLLRRALEAVPVSCFTRVAVVTQYPQGFKKSRGRTMLCPPAMASSLACAYRSRRSATAWVGESHQTTSGQFRTGRTC